MDSMQSVKHLLTEFIPERYTLSLAINREARSFEGTVTLHGESINGHIIVHAKDLTIKSILIDGEPASHRIGKHDEVELIQAGLKPGVHDVIIEYAGVITDTLHGLYPCRFTHNGTQKELMMTQFESHYAREMLPCIDEPEAKATFDVSVITESDVQVLGNMPIRSQSQQNGRLSTTFDTTPRMSTYLLALVVGELHKKSGKTKDGVEVSVWATPAQTPESLDFALDHAIRTIEFYNEYFGIPYPLPKSDHVAVPDFSNGAMENWGLITYRESALIADPVTSSLDSREYIATVIAHELSHQWFGNLVTMKWWNNLWLNESFATVMEYVAVDALHPDWNVWQDFASNEGTMAMRRDAIDGVQSVQIDVNHPDEISSIFDGAIVYAKGARLMNMMRSYVGEEAYRAGLEAYFRKHAYGNTTEDDLWDALTVASGKNVAHFMTAWITQPGFPVVRVALKKQELVLTQNQFFVGPHESTQKTWPIPLDAELSVDLLDKDTATIARPDSLVFLNQFNTGHYLTQYEGELWSDILAAVTSGTLTESQRIQFLLEQTMLARSERIDSSSLIRLLDAYRGEVSEKVWDAMAVAINELKRFVENDSKAEQHLRRFVRELAAKQYEKLGWDAHKDETESDTKLRATIIGCVLYGELPDALAEAKRRFDSTTFSELDPELRTLISSAVVRHYETPELTNTLLQYYTTSQNVDLKIDLCAALTSTKNKATIHRLITLLSDTESIRTQDTAQWFAYLLRNREARESTWSWLQNSWEWIDKTFGDDKSFDRFPRYAASLLSTPQHLQEYRTFFTPLRSDVALTRTIDMGVRDLEGRVGLIKRQAASVCTALNNL